MSNAVTVVIPPNFGQVSSVFAGVPVENDLGAGVTQGFALVGYRGKVWSLRHRGEEKQLMRDDGDGPRSSIEVVIVKASPVIGKIWYEKGYVEGSSEAPDCFSSNGVVPDPSSPKKQCDTCALCEKNKWGSAPARPGQPPSKGKACSDSKRYAVVPLADIQNETYGGPMLLRVPATSMGAGADYGTMMGKLGYPYYSVGTRIQFDPKESYPKFIFGAIRPLSDEEAQMVKELQGDPRTARVLADDQAPAPVAAPTVQSVFEQPPVAALPAPPPSPPPPPPPPTQPKLKVVEAAPKTVLDEPPFDPDTGEVSKFEADLDAQLDALLPK